MKKWVDMAPDEKCSLTLIDASEMREEAGSLVEEAMALLDDVHTSLADAKRMEEYAEKLRLGEKVEPFHG
tara:strand:+ start:2593 stop:2802 length:210 start_codon:yes stop_codon:yes gene_type:complete